MSMYLKTLIISFFACFFYACQSDKQPSEEVQADVPNVTAPLSQDGQVPNLSDADREVAISQAEQKKKAKAALEKKGLNFDIKDGPFDGFLKGNWTFDIKVDVETGIDTSWKGNILQLHGDETFQIYTPSGDLDQSGNFTWDRNTTTLRLIPATGQASEWTVSYMDGTAIFVGTSTFRNNMTQIKVREGLHFGGG